MSSCKLLTDPLQNFILLDDCLAGTTLPVKYVSILDQAEEVISHPAYIINAGQRGIYYFKCVCENTNVLMEAQLKDEVMVIKTMIINPSIEYISKLLKMGKLICFPAN